jgi:hypothetical protein
MPDYYIERLSKVAERDKKLVAEEGIKICVEQIQRLRAIEGVAGIHLMAIEWEHKVREIVERAGLMPRPAVASPVRVFDAADPPRWKKLTPRRFGLLSTPDLWGRVIPICASRREIPDRR